MTKRVAPGALANHLQRRTACNTSPATLSKMADGVWKYVKPYVIEPSDQLLLNKFFDSIIPSENLKNPKWPPWGLKMADGVLKMVYP